MIQEELAALRVRTIREFCGVMEFKAFTDLAYLTSSQEISASPHTDGGAILSYADFGPHLGVPDETVEASDLPHRIEAAKDGYFLSLVHQHQVAIFEHILFDILRVILLEQPIRLPSDRKIEYSVVVAAPSKAEILQVMVDRELNELKYKGVADWFAFVQKLVSSCSVPTEDVGRISEAKASRDILVHNAGLANDIYVRKSGAWARFESGQVVSVTGTYTLECWQTFSRVLIHLIDEFHSALVGTSAGA
jgi:hypothetical protein